MTQVLILYFSVYFTLLFALVAIGFVLQMKRENLSSIGGETVRLEDLVVIIPFRNEENRIHVLLDSIKRSNKHPKEYVFVDDHSTDKTVECIELALVDLPFRVLALEDNLQGKKQAIRAGITESESSYILSWDADVSFSPFYFDSLSKIVVDDMAVLPAIMKAERELEHLYEVDLLLVNAANCGIAGWKRPIMASGANLLYRRASFVKYDRFSEHIHMPSGDDIYLLRDFRNGKAQVDLHTSTDLAIYTETPQSLKEFIHQRLRWIAKTGDVKDHLSTFLAMIQAVLTFTFVFLLIYFGIHAEWRLFAIVFITKTLADLLIFLPFFNRVKRLHAWLFIPLYEILFPIYSLVILSLMYTFKPIWKGRKLERNF